MKLAKKFLVLGMLAVMMAFCMAPGLAFAAGVSINQELMDENDGKYTINAGGIYDLAEDVEGSIYINDPSSAVQVFLNGHTLTNTKNENALCIKQSNDYGVTVDGQNSSGSGESGSIVQIANGNAAIKIDVLPSKKLYLNTLKVKTQGAECLEAQKGTIDLTNVEMSASKGVNPLIHTYGAKVTLCSGTFTKSSAAQAMFSIESDGEIVTSGGSYNEFPKGTTLDEIVTLYKQAAGNYQVVREDSEVLDTHLWKVTLDDKSEVNFTDDTKDIYFSLKSEAKAFAGDKYTVSEVNAEAATALTDTAVSLKTSSYTYDGTAKKPGVSVVVDGKTLVEGQDYELSYKSNVEAGTAYAVVEGMNDYKGSIEKKFTINKSDLSAAKVTLSKTAFTYNGKAQKPSVKSVVLNGKTLKSGTDYTASIASGKKVGTYKVTINAKGSSYSGKATASFVVNPKGVSKFKVSKAKKTFKAKWTKNKTERSGVQIRYSTKKSMAGAKTVKAKGASVKAKTVKKLKKKTKYYVQARSYKVVNGKTYYSSWSAKKAVKTK